MDPAAKSVLTAGVVWSSGCGMSCSIESDSTRTCRSVWRDFTSLCSNPRELQLDPSRPLTQKSSVSSKLVNQLPKIVVQGIQLHAKYVQHQLQGSPPCSSDLLQVAGSNPVEGTLLPLIDSFRSEEGLLLLCQLYGKEVEERLTLRMEEDCHLGWGRGS